MHKSSSVPNDKVNLATIHCLQYSQFWLRNMAFKIQTFKLFNLFSLTLENCTVLVLTGQRVNYAHKDTY